MEVLQLYDKIIEQKNLEQMLDVYSDRLIGYIMSYTKDIYSAEDIMMDTFVALIDKRPTFDNEKKLSAWLFTTARNKALNLLKKEKKFVPLTEELLASKENVEKNLYKSALSKVVGQEMKKLAPKYQDILYLCYIEEMEMEEISNVLKLTLKQTYNLKHRAKNKLNQRMKKMGYMLEEEVKYEN